MNFLYTYAATEVLNLPQTAADSNTAAIVINIAFAIVGAVALLVLVLAGFQFVISKGEPEKVATARRTIAYAVVGLVVVVSANLIVNFVIGSVAK